MEDDKPKEEMREEKAKEERVIYVLKDDKKLPWYSSLFRNRAVISILSAW